jgi:hypothetical protein
MRLRVRQHQRHWTSGQQPSEPAPTELAEYHALLLRTSFARAHPLHDAAIESLPEVLDFSLAVQRFGGRCWLEPAAVAVFLTPAWVLDANRPLFAHRWSDRIQRRGIAHFRRKWGLGPWSWVLGSQLSWVVAHRSLIRSGALHRHFSLEVYGLLNRRLLAPLQEWFSSYS